MDIRLRIANIVYDIARKLRINPSTDNKFIKRYRNLIYYNQSINLNSVLSFFEKCPDHRVDTRTLQSRVQAAQGSFNKFCGCTDENKEYSNEIPKIIWLYWNGGLEAAPEVVQLAYQSWKQMNPGYEVRFLDDNNIKQYIDLNLLFSISSVDITLAGQSDFLRTYLLATYGGIWADSTTFCWKPLDNWLPQQTYKSGFFIFRQPETRLDRQIASWFIASSKGNPIISSLLNLLCNYLFETREIILTMRKPRHYMHYENISRTGTGEALLNRMAHENTYPYFFYHYLFNVAVSSGIAREIWDVVKTTDNKHAKNHGEIADAVVSKQTYKGQYMYSETYNERKRMLCQSLSESTQ